ncbi:MAG: YDG domain-containing protein, partial [Gammaproteobacteria bacterium]|nr:YDG domain-containing protein [Gammaproteobacteria bacterium]
MKLPAIFASLRASASRLLAAAIGATLLTAAAPAAAQQTCTQTNKCTLTVTPAAGQSKVYGNPEPDYVYTVSGYGAGDDEENTLLAEDKRSNPLTRQGATSRSDAANDNHQFELRGNVKDIFLRKAKRKLYRVVLGGGAANRRFSVTKRPISYTATGVNKVYDGTDAAPSDLGGGFADGDIIAVDEGEVGLSHSGKYQEAGGVAAAAAGANKTIGDFGASLTGNRIFHYRLASVTASGAITPRPLTLSNVVLTKSHDGNTGVSGATVSADIGNVVSGQTVALSLKSGATAAFDSAAQGAGKTVTGLGADDLEITVTGGHGADSYSLPGGAIAATGTIAAAASAAPSAPAGVTAAAGGAFGELDLSWTALNDNSVSGYLYRWSNDGDASDWESANGASGVEFSGDGDTAGFTIGSLAAGVEYVVQIAAKNSEGDSPWSASTTAAAALSAPGAPGITAATAAVDAITVQWDAPGDTGGGALTGYKIRWAITPRSGDPVWLNANGAAGQDTAGGAGTRSETISDLVPRAPYMVQIAAVNSGGAGAFSASSSATPTARADDADIRSITVTVNTSVGDEVTLSPAFSRNITTYTARIPADVPGVVFAGVFSGNEIDDVDQDDFGVSKLSHSPYRFVTGRTDFDIGENTLKLVVTAADGSTTKTYTFNITRQVGPPLVAPATPTLANGSAAGSLDVSWSAVAASGNGGSAITAYQVRWGKDPATGSVNWNGAGSGVQAGDATARAYTITGLETGTAYQVQVAAVNAEGIGVWSASATETPSAAATNADITALTVSTADGVTAVSLDTPFVSSTTEYTADVATDVAGVIFTATYVGSKLVIAGDADNDPASGAASEAVALTVGVAKDITLVVTAQDGSTTRTYTVTVTRAAGAPAKPAKPTAARSTTVSGSVDVAWTWSGGADNNGAAVTAFHVQWKKTGDSNWLPNATGQEISNPSDRAYAVTGLEAGANYHARVRAVNSVGNGAWSDNSNAAAASGPPRPPATVTVLAVSGGLAVQIPNFSLDTGGPPLAGYRFRWRTAAANGPDGLANTADDVAAGAWQDESGANDRGHFVAVQRYSINGLTGGVRYDVQGARQNAAPSDNVSTWVDGQTLAPTRKAIDISPSRASKAYGAADPAVDYPLPNFLALHPTKAHVFTADPFERVPGENAGEYNYRLKDPLPWVTAGNPAGAYSVTLDGRNKFTITKKEVTYTSTAADKTYDGNVNAPSDLGGSFSAGVVNTSVNGVTIDDTATGKLSVTGGRFGDKTAGDNKAVTQFVLDGDSKDNYTLAAGSSVTGDIAKLATTLTLNVNARVYDGTTNTGAVTAVFSPEIVGGDTVTVDVSSAVYADADAGTGKTINGVADAQISGGDKGNYEITIVATGEVTKRPLRVAAGGSGNAVPNTAALGDRSLLTIASGVSGEGLVSPDTAATVLSGSIALGDESGSAPRFTSPLTIGTLAASGNYELIFTAGEFVRSSLQTLVVTPAETTRVFGGTDPTFTWTVAPQSGSAFITGDSASTQFFTAGQTVVQRAAGNDAGRYAFSLADPLPTASGIDAKYLFVIAPGAEYTITPKPLTATAITLTKEYDGAATIAGATIGGGVLSGLEGSDAAVLALKSDAVGAYADADAGESKTLNGVDSADFEISATDPAKAGNYAVPSSLSVSGEITAKEVTVAAVTLTKEYDGDATLGASIIKTGTGEITGEAGSESLVLTPTAGDYDAAGAGARSVSGADFDLASPDSSAKPENYALPASLSVDGEITAKEVAVADVTVTKTFDNTTSMTGVVVTGGAVTGAVGSQTFTLQLAAANDGVFDSANVGTGINVSGADFELAALAGDTASDPANYALPEVTVAGVIEPKELTFSGVATLRKSYDGTNAAEATGANAVEVVGGVIAGAVGANT